MKSKLGFFLSAFHEGLLEQLAASRPTVVISNNVELLQQVGKVLERESLLIAARSALPMPDRDFFALRPQEAADRWVSENAPRIAEAPYAFWCGPASTDYQWWTHFEIARQREMFRNIGRSCVQPSAWYNQAIFDEDFSPVLDAAHNYGSVLYLPVGDLVDGILEGSPNNICALPSGTVRLVLERSVVPYSQEEFPAQLAELDQRLAGYPRIVGLGVIPIPNLEEPDVYYPLLADYIAQTADRTAVHAVAPIFLRELPDLMSRRVQNVFPSEPLEIVRTDGAFTRLRTPDNQEGWALSIFVKGLPS